MEATAPPSRPRRPPDQDLWRPLAVSMLTVIFIAILFVGVVRQTGPSSQAASLSVAIDGISPAANAGLRVDVLISLKTGLAGCSKTAQVTAIISGTPSFWSEYGPQLRGHHRIGIGLRTKYDNMRVLDWSGYELPMNLRTAEYRVEDKLLNPDRSGKVQISEGRDTVTGVRWYTADIEDWGDHWTPLVMQFDAAWTSYRSLGSCFVVLPELVALDDSTSNDARAAASGRSSVFEELPDGSLVKDDPERTPQAVTGGRVVLGVNARILDGESRPAPKLVDGNPWASGLGEIGDDVAVWTCSQPPGRDAWPDADAASPNGKEKAMSFEGAAWQGCGGIAAVEARAAGTTRDLALLVIGGLFGAGLASLTKAGHTVIKRAKGSKVRARSIAGKESKTSPSK